MTRDDAADCSIVAIVAAVTAAPWLVFAFGPTSPQNFFFGSRPETAHILGLPVHPSGGPAGYLGIAAAYMLLPVAIVFMKSTITRPAALAAAFALIAGGFVSAFAAIYVQLSHDSPGSCFNAPVTKLDAIYFTLGTLSTAGTGDLTVVSEQCRAIVSAQLVAGFVMATIAVAGLVSRLMHDSS
jgi:ion channel